MIKIRIFYILGLTLCSIGLAETPVNHMELESKTKVFEKAYCEKCFGLGYQNRAEGSGRMNFYGTDNRQYQQEIIRVKDGNSYTLVFLKESGQLIEFSDENAYNKIFGKEAPKYEKPPLPQWSSEKAIALAKPFLVVFLGEAKVFLSAPQAKYGHPLGGRDGYWQVTWIRTDSKGRPFEYDETVEINISESAGPLGGYIKLAAIYHEPTGEPLKETEVQEKAWKMAQKTLNWGPVKGMLDPGHLDPKPIRSELRVVRPNHLLDHKEVNTRADLEARLAWIFWYAWRLDNNPKQIQSVAVWIDAYTGEILGGDAAMN